MKAQTAQELYKLVSEGRHTKAEFIRQMRQQFPNYINQFNGFEDTVLILKNKGVLVENTLDRIVKPEDRFSFETIERGIDVELEMMGIDSINHVTTEQREKAKTIVLKKLEKNPLHYLDMLAGSKGKNEHDDFKEYKKESAVDKENGMQKVNLKEQKRTQTENQKRPLIKNKLSNYKKTDLKESKEKITHRQPTALTKDKQELLKEAIKKVITKILKEDSNLITEAAARNLEEYIHYDNDRNPELSRKVRQAANQLAEQIYAIEKQYLSSRDKIEDIFKAVGHWMAPSLRDAFVKDIRPVLAMYQEIKIPTYKQESGEQLDPNQDQELNEVRSKKRFFNSKGELI